MNIAVITGSPHKNGTTALLADEFIRGASEAGNDVFRFDAAFRKVHPCIGCGRCDGNAGIHCSFTDDMDELYKRILKSDLIVLVSPVYYWTLSPQILGVISRWEYMVQRLRGKKLILLTARYNPDDTWTLEPIRLWYRNLQKSVGLIGAGEIHAVGAETRKELELTEYPKQAYLLGRKTGAESADETSG